MRILLAFDGSPSSETALALAGSLSWPTCSVVEILGVTEPVFDLADLSILAKPGSQHEHGIGPRISASRSRGRSSGSRRRHS